MNRDDIDAADAIWSRAAVHFLAEATQAPDYSDKGIVRGEPPQFERAGAGAAIVPEMVFPEDACRVKDCEMLTMDMQAALTTSSSPLRELRRRRLTTSCKSNLAKGLAA